MMYKFDMSAMPKSIKVTMTININDHKYNCQQLSFTVKCDNNKTSISVIGIKMNDERVELINRVLNGYNVQTLTNNDLLNKHSRLISKYKQIIKQHSYDLITLVTGIYCERNNRTIQPKDGDIVIRKNDNNIGIYYYDYIYFSNNIVEYIKEGNFDRSYVIKSNLIVGAFAEYIQQLKEEINQNNKKLSISRHISRCGKPSKTLIPANVYIIHDFPTKYMIIYLGYGIMVDMNTLISRKGYIFLKVFMGRFNSNFATNEFFDMIKSYNVISSNELIYDTDREYMVYEQPEQFIHFMYHLGLFNIDLNKPLSLIDPDLQTVKYMFYKKEF